MSSQQKTDIEVLQKLRSFCAYRERSVFEVELKARELGVEKVCLDFYMEPLKQEGFVDDKRFAELYARSKFRQNQWGKYKIRAALMEKRVSPSLIDLALTEIEEDAYEQTAISLIEKLIDKGKSSEQIFQNMKSKGFEGELIYSILQAKKLV